MVFDQHVKVLCKFRWLILTKLKTNKIFVVILKCRSEKQLWVKTILNNHCFKKLMLDISTELNLWRNSHKAVHFRRSIPIAPFLSKSNFAHHFISARFKHILTSQTSGPLPTVPKLGRQIFGTVSDGWRHYDIGTKNGHFAILWLAEMAIFVPTSQTSGPSAMVLMIRRSNFRTVADDPEDFSS